MSQQATFSAKLAWRYFAFVDALMGLSLGSVAVFLSKTDSDSASRNAPKAVLGNELKPSHEGFQRLAITLQRINIDLNPFAVEIFRAGGKSM